MFFFQKWCFDEEIKNWPYFARIYVYISRSYTAKMRVIACLVFLENCSIHVVETTPSQVHVICEPMLNYMYTVHVHVLLTFSILPHKGGVSVTLIDTLIGQEPRMNIHREELGEGVVGRGFYQFTKYCLTVTIESNITLTVVYLITFNVNIIPCSSMTCMYKYKYMTLHVDLNY